MNLFSYFRDTTADQARGEVTRVLPESRNAYLLALKDGTSVKMVEGEDAEVLRATGESEGRKFTYIEVPFSEWWSEAVTAEEKGTLTEQLPEGFFLAPGVATEGQLVCRLSDGEPATQEELEAAGLGLEEVDESGEEEIEDEDSDPDVDADHADTDSDEDLDVGTASDPDVDADHVDADSDEDLDVGTASDAGDETGEDVQ